MEILEVNMKNLQDLETRSQTCDTHKYESPEEIVEHLLGRNVETGTVNRYMTENTPCVIN